MARDKDEEYDDEQEDEQEDEAVRTSSRGPQPPRISITVPETVRKRVRLAAALSDLEVNEWCRVVLAQAAKRTVQKRYPDRV